MSRVNNVFISNYNKMVDKFNVPEEGMANNDEIIRGLQQGIFPQKVFERYTKTLKEVMADMQVMQDDINQREQKKIIKKNLITNIESGNVDAAIALFNQNPLLADEVYEKIDKFSLEDQKKLLDVIIEKEYGRMLLKYLDKIVPQERKNIVLRIFENGYEYCLTISPNERGVIVFGILKNINHIQVEDQIEVMKYLMKKYENDTIMRERIVGNISSFDPSLHKEILEFVIKESLDERLGMQIIENINKITGMTKTEVLMLLAENFWMAFAVEQSLDRFVLLDGSIAIALLKTRRGNHRYTETGIAISNNMKSFNAMHHDMIKFAF